MRIVRSREGSTGRRIGVVAVCAAIAAAGVLPAQPGAAATYAYMWYGEPLMVHDGDTVKVDRPPNGTELVRLAGVQAIDDPFTRDRTFVPECHGPPASRKFRLLLRWQSRVRVSGDHQSFGTRDRLLRFVGITRDGQWRDVGTILTRGGWVLWRASRKEPAHNLQYHRAAEAAARRGIQMWDPDACGNGPQDYVPIRVQVHYDARGDDAKNLNGEWVRITNRHASQPLQLGGWWVRDAANRRYVFASGTKILPGRSVKVHVGRGSDTRRHLYWGRRHPVFVNPANNGLHMGDGAYLFDPQGDLRAHDMYPCVSRC